ncbi:MAG: C4-type zinc ribbon domain-containing protein [Caldilineaceae bacterium]
MVDIAKLYELQKTDLNWEKVKRRLIQIQKLMGEPEEIKSARQQVNETEAKLQKWQAEQKNAELESQQLFAKMTSSEQLLMSGQVHNAKELQSLQSSIEALKRQRTTVDGRGVDAMIQVDESSTLLAKQKGTLAQLETKLREKHGELAEEETKLKRMFLQLKTHRAKLTGGMSAADIELYEDLRRRKGGIAVAAVDKVLCTACNTRLPTSAAAAARDFSQVTYCPTCGRILVQP